MGTLESRRPTKADGLRRGRSEGTLYKTPSDRIHYKGDVKVALFSVFRPANSRGNGGFGSIVKIPFTIRSTSEGRGLLAPQSLPMSPRSLLLTRQDQLPFPKTYSVYRANTASISFHEFKRYPRSTCRDS